LKQYTSKKLSVNPNLDKLFLLLFEFFSPLSTVKASVDCLVTEVEGLLNKELAFSGRVLEISVEIDAFVKEKEIKRKKVS
jgi:hypothetical protein